MNHKRGLPAFIVVFLAIFAFGFLWHGILMKDAYLQTASLWRAEDDFHRHFWILIVGHAVLAFAFTGLYVSKVGVRSVATGIGYGIVIGILYVSVEIIRFAVEPLTRQILLMWVAGDLLQFALAGALVGAIYKPLDTAQTSR